MTRLRDRLEQQAVNNLASYLNDPGIFLYPLNMTQVSTI